MQERTDQTCYVSEQTTFFFDLDGTLVNTDYANYLSYRGAIAVVMRDGTLTPTYDPSRRLNRSLLRTLYPSLTQSDYNKIIVEKEKLYRDYLSETSIVKDNTDILLKYAPTHKIVLVTHCRLSRVLDTLSYYGLTDKFDTLLCREAIPDKQAPDKYSNAIHLLGIPPDHIIAFEDEESEIACALNAGIITINPNHL